MYILSKLDGVGPIDNRPFTNKLHHFTKNKQKKYKKKYKKKLHVTHDI